MMRHACTPPVANLGPLNPYVAAAFEEWGLGGGGSGAGGGVKQGLTAVVARQAAAAPPSTTSPAADLQLQHSSCYKRMNDCFVNKKGTDLAISYA